MTDTLARLSAALNDRYEVEREIGHGGMATVYRALDVRHQRPVAIKVLHPELAAAVGAERFLREIAIAAQLQHPNILTLIDSGTADGLLYYVMPFVEGESLRDRIGEGRERLPVPEVVRLLLEITDALTEAHRLGVAHRDVKPENVMLSGRHALVVDFGVAKALREATSTHALTSVGISLGTPTYMAPEQAAADPAADHRVDIYAVGVLAYELLTGKPPFTGSPQAVLAAHISSAPAPVSKVRPDLPAALAAVVMRCLRKDPAERFATAEELHAALQSVATPATGTVPAILRIGTTSRGRRRIALAAVVLVAIVSLAGWKVVTEARHRAWARDTAVPEIQRLLELAGGADIALNDSLYRLAKRALEYAPNDSVVRATARRVTAGTSIRTEPAGATVLRTRYDDSTQWERVGVTPFDSVRVPRGISRWRIEHDGYRPLMLAAGPGAISRITLRLDSLNAPYSEMVLVPGDSDVTASVIGLDHVQGVTLDDYRIDRYEVTNAEYKRFVDAGGYSKPEYWSADLPAGADFRTTVARFTDRTGRPGPATWEGGAPPSGQENLPVAGVSWYEASAYARFAGKSLPTVFHWARAAAIGAAQFVVPGSNFGTQGTRAASTFAGMSPFGTFDMAGNVREWCLNTDGDRRYILGGGWNDEEYGFTDSYAADPLDRSPTNGIRLMLSLRGENQSAARLLRMKERDYSKETPVPDIVYAGFRRMYDYDSTPLAASLDGTDSSNADWIVERVSYAAAYGGERIPALLYLPKHVTPPYQVVLFFPGSNALHSSSSDAIPLFVFDWLLRGGRAVLHPIYKSTYERGDSLKSDYAEESVFYRDHVLMWGKDVRRSVDYLVTRPDIDTSAIAYYGVSWGGYLGGIFPAIEPRFKASILYVAGLARDRGMPEVEPINFLPRIRTPVLMLNGRYDHFFPVESAQKPFFRLLGTPAEHKRYVLYDGGHNVPRERLIAESMDFLDRYLGPVR
jgi:formylglycine-generating enzyme required for sulfatase activity/tRNA A-37 threonylcarbamoyl transferase component Bud32/dienelactone hydrolase